MKHKSGATNGGLRALAGFALALAAGLLLTCRWADATTLSPRDLSDVFPDATAVGDPAGSPPVMPVFRDGKIAGYAFFSHETVASTGFSGRPVDVLVGLGLDGIITGAKLVEQHEPILAIGVDAKQLEAFIAQYRGRDIRRPLRFGMRAGGDRIDSISGATVSSIVLSDAILRSARMVARSRGILAGAYGGGELDLERFEPIDWAGLAAEGSIAHLRLTNDEIARAAAGSELAGTPDGLFIDLYVAPLTPARIGRNLLGDRDYATLMARLAKGEQALIIAANGLYSFKGTSFTRTGIFERVQITQRDRTIQLTAARHERLERLAGAQAPALNELGVFTVAAEPGLALAEPWRLDLLVRRPRLTGGEALARFSVDYRLPAVYFLVPAVQPLSAASAAPLQGLGTGVPTFLDLLAPDPASGERPLWQQIWREHPVKIAVLLATLLVLGAILVFQHWLAHQPRFYRMIRFSFLAFTLLWLGWYAGAQLSVLNALTFVHALLAGFRWEFFLVDPLLFILWSSVAVALLFWGRGVYCGWLCPFGALQELAGAVARRLGVPQFQVPFVLHERLWPLKYVIFLGLLALSLQSLDGVVPWVEVEPFKTVIALKFVRAWPFVLYAMLLLGAGLFVERLFCRYLCPLGAALAIPARIRMFEWLKRRRQCGTECQICAKRCPVQAVHPEGNINPNECIHCLGCQVAYHDDCLCPPLIARRKLRAARARSAYTPVPRGDMP